VPCWNVLKHPEIVIQLTFHLVQSVSAYGAWAGERMFSQIVNETRSFLL
jgi:hypothetical protein